MHERFKDDERVRVVAVATAFEKSQYPWMADEKKIREALKQQGLEFPVMRDEEEKSVHLVGVGNRYGTPMTLVLDPDGSRFLEQDVGAGAVVDEYRRLAEDPAADVDAERVARLADVGDNAARQALALCGKRLGVGLAVLVNLLNPERIVIGGGVAGAGEWFLEPARIEGERRAWVQSWAQCQVVPAALGTTAGAVGAALLGLE